MIMLQFLREIFVLFLTISFLVPFKNCCALTQETTFTRLSEYDDVLPVDSTHYMSELEQVGRIQCGLECSVIKPHCAGILYNHDLKSCILLNSYLNSKLVNQDKLWHGWKLFINTNACQPGWSPFDGHCYYLNRTLAVHNEASAMCQQHEGYLVEVDSEEENTWLTQEFSASSWIWIGISDKVKDGEYRWTRPNSQVTYTAWQPGEPNGGSRKNCGGLADSGGWNDMNCNYLFKYICERDF